MSHMPRFWREAGFKGWPAFLAEHIKNQPGKRFNAKELAKFFEPHSLNEQNKILGGIGNALDNMKKRGLLAMEREGRAGYYFVPEPKPQPEPGVIEMLPSEIPELVPRKVFYQELNRKRIDQIGNVVLHRIDQGKEIPLEWIQEYNELVKC